MGGGIERAITPPTRQHLTRVNFYDIMYIETCEGDRVIMSLLERKRDEIISVVAEYWDKHGYAPTFEEIGQAVGLQKGSVYALCLRIPEIMWERKISRSIRLVKDIAAGASKN